MLASAAVLGSGLNVDDSTEYSDPGTMNQVARLQISGPEHLSVTLRSGPTVVPVGMNQVYNIRPENAAVTLVISDPDAVPPKRESVHMNLQPGTIRLVKCTLAYGPILEGAQAAPGPMPGAGVAMCPEQLISQLEMLEQMAAIGATLRRLDVQIITFQAEGKATELNMALARQADLRKQYDEYVGAVRALQAAKLWLKVEGGTKAESVRKSDRPSPGGEAAPSPVPDDRLRKESKNDLLPDEPSAP
ncbi:MAG: hypothetical protein IT428_24395 [Planctomycetaceae bacterium]|nr:hypothetical protein [Planctomycetaceae bacterium]